MREGIHTMDSHKKMQKLLLFFAWGYTNMHGYKAVENKKCQWHIRRKQDRLA
jgi:hypothetical protein